MKIATFNVNSIRARMEIVLEWLKEESPDVLCVQETKAVDDDFPKQPFLDLNYHLAFRGEKSYNGVAIISRLALEDVRFGFDKKGSEGTRMVSARINNIPVVNTYIPQGFEPSSEKFAYKLKWFKRLYDYFNKNFSPDEPLLWVGDFNVAPTADDVHSPDKLLGHVCYHPDEHAALRKFTQWGFTDVFRRHQPGPGQYSFYDYRAKNAVKRKMGWRVDHIWATRPLADKSVNARIDITPRLKERPSDHTPVIAEFKI